MSLEGDSLEVSFAIARYQFSVSIGYHLFFRGRTTMQ